jgi:hypothetical protein
MLKFGWQSVQVVEYLLSKHETLSSKASTAKTNKKYDAHIYLYHMDRRRSEHL